MIESETKEEHLLRYEAMRIATLAPSAASRAALIQEHRDELADFIKTPTKLLTTELLQQAILWSGHLFDQHEVQPSSDYEESVHRLFSVCPLVLQHLHGAFITDAMAEVYLEVAKKDQAPASNKRVLPFRVMLDKPGFEPGPIFVNGYMAENISNVAYLDQHHTPLIKDETLQKSVEEDPSRLPVLFWKKLKRGRLLARMVKEGFDYPYLPTTLLASSAPSIQTLLEHLLSYQDRAGNEIELECCKGLLQRHPIEDIMRAHPTREQSACLTQVFQWEALRPYMKTTPGLKEGMLMDALGL
jgi:hypothetical protein